MRLRVVLLTLLVWLPGVSQAASIFLTANSSAYLVFETMVVDVWLESQGPEGPGEVEFTLRWDARARLSGPWVGAAVLEQPVSFGPGFAAAPGSSVCSDVVGLVSGACSVQAIASAAVTGTVQVAQLRMQYQWIPADGYELCPIRNAPGCVPGDPTIPMSAVDLSVFGASSPSVPGLILGNQGADPQVRAIPEPGSAGLVALGVSMLGWRARRARSARVV